MPPLQRRVAAALSCLILAVDLAPVLAQRGVGPAEPQMRIARRLAAEGSPDAAAAFARVATDHPGDPLVDDALVEHAAWLGAPAWPEGLAALSEDRARAAFTLLKDAADMNGDRRSEAACRLALLQVGFALGRNAGDRSDLAWIRPKLIEVATSHETGAWSEAARYALAWVDEGTGGMEKARAAYQRLIVDDPEGEAGRRAVVGLGRVLLRQGEAGRAAARFQEAVERGIAPELGAADLRELAVRALLRSVPAAASWSGRERRTWASGLRGASAIARVPGAGTLVVDRRAGAVALFDAEGRPVRTWPTDGVQAIAVDPLGRVYAAAGQGILRLSEDGRVATIASQGDFAPVSSIAVDGAGRVYLVDRRGDRIGRIEPGADGPSLVRERRGAGFSAIAWDGSRLLAGEQKTGRVVEIGGDGAETPVVATGATSASEIAVDLAGTIAVVDSRSDAVSLFGPKGDLRDRFEYGAAGFGRVAGVAFGRDGSLELLEGSTGIVVRLP